MAAVPVNTFPCAIIAQPRLTTRWRTSLTEIRNHLSRVTAGRGCHEEFLYIKDRRGHLFFFFAFFFNFLVDQREKAIAQLIFRADRKCELR